MNVQSTVVTLPSGIEADIREMTGREEDLFTNQTLVKAGKVASTLLGNVILTLDAKKPTSDDVKSLLSADRNAILMTTRLLSFGPEFSTDLSCTNCEHSFSIDLDLEQDVAYLETPEDQNPTVTLPSGKVVTLRPMTGNDETAFLGAQKNNELPTASLFARIESVEGLDSKQEIKTWIKDATLRDRRALRKACEKAEFGYQTRVTIECPNCDNELEFDVASVRDFFFPKD